MEPGVPLRLRVVGAPRRDAWARLPVALAQATHDALALDVSGGGGLPLPLELVADLGLPGTPAPRWLVAWDGGSSAGADLELSASLMACLGEFSFPIHEDPPAPPPPPPPLPPRAGLGEVLTGVRWGSSSVQGSPRERSCGVGPLSGCLRAPVR